MSVSPQADRFLDKPVAMRTGPGDPNGEGLCIAYADHPTLSVRMPDGSHQNWGAHLSRPLEGDEAAAYWRRVAEHWQRKAEENEPHGEMKALLPMGTMREVMEFLRRAGAEYPWTMETLQVTAAALLDTVHRELEAERRDTEWGE